MTHCYEIININYCGKYVSVKVDCGMNAQQSSYLPSVHHVMGHVTRDRYSKNLTHNLISYKSLKKQRFKIKNIKKNELNIFKITDSQKQIFKILLSEINIYSFLSSISSVSFILLII